MKYVIAAVVVAVVVALVGYAYLMMTLPRM